MGLGVVGGGVFRRIAAHDNQFEIVKIMVRSPDKYLDQGYRSEVLTTDFADLVAAKPDVFIDVSGGIEPALGHCKAMLEKGVHVVSANKQAIAAGGQGLLDFAVDHGAQLRFSSAAGGGMPVLEMCLRQKGRITRVQALLNGTTNYMLDEIGKGRSYAEALKDAQDKGFAEADPTADVGGADAAAKDLSTNNFLAQADGEEAHAVFDFDDGDQYRIRGKGAGRWPTTESVMADLFDISATTLG